MPWPDSEASIAELVEQVGRCCRGEPSSTPAVRWALARPLDQHQHPIAAIKAPGGKNLGFRSEAPLDRPSADLVASSVALGGVLKKRSKHDHLLITAG